MNRALLILPLALALQGCVLDKISDPSKPTPAQQAMVDAGMFGVMTEMSVTPECTSDEFRVFKCHDGLKYAYWTGERMQ